MACTSRSRELLRGGGDVGRSSDNVKGGVCATGYVVDVRTWRIQDGRVEKKLETIRINFQADAHDVLYRRLKEIDDSLGLMCAWKM